jgi:hypothetical protein
MEQTEWIRQNCVLIKLASKVLASHEPQQTKFAKVFRAGLELLTFGQPDYGAFCKVSEKTEFRT